MDLIQSPPRAQLRPGPARAAHTAIASTAPPVRGVFRHGLNRARSDSAIFNASERPNHPVQTTSIRPGRTIKPASASSRLASFASWLSWTVESMNRAGTEGTDPCRWHRSALTRRARARTGPLGERAESRSGSSTRHTESTLQTGPSQDCRTKLILRIEPDVPPRLFDSTRNRPNLTPLAFTSCVASARTSTYPERPAAAVTFPFKRDVDSRDSSSRSSKGAPLWHGPFLSNPFCTHAPSATEEGPLSCIHAPAPDLTRPATGPEGAGAADCNRRSCIRGLAAARLRPVPVERRDLAERPSAFGHDFRGVPDHLGPALAGAHHICLQDQTSLTGASKPSQPGRIVPVERHHPVRQDRCSARTPPRREARTGGGPAHDPLQPNDPRAADWPCRVIDQARLGPTSEAHHQQRRRPDHLHLLRTGPRSLTNRPRQVRASTPRLTRSN